MIFRIFFHFRQNNATEPTHLRFRENELQTAESVTVEGTCCWKICSTQNDCTKKLIEGQNIELKIEEIFKIDVVSCHQALTSFITNAGVKGEFIFFGSFMFVSCCCLFAIVFYLA